ncbi:hypothetical protein EMIT0111MI5_60374 [Burkholderia sp. IT-111MI5]
MRGQLVHQRRQAAHVLHLRDLRAEIVQVEVAALLDLVGELLRGLHVDAALRFLDEREDVAHAEDPVRHPVGVEHLEAVELFGDTDELDRLARDVAHRQRGAAARIAVELGQHDAGERQRVVERLRGVDRVLAEHRVDDEQRFGRLQRAVQRGDFLHHRLVDAEAAGRVDDQHVMVVALRPVDGRQRDVDGLLVRRRREEVGADLFAHRFQLHDGGRTIHVARHGQHLLLVLLAQQLRELADGRGLARALQAGHQDHGGRRDREIQLGGLAFVVAADHGGQFLLDHADERLTRRQAADHFFAERLFLDLGDEFADDRQRHVGFQQRETHLAEHLLRVGLGEPGLAAQRLDDARHPLSEIVEHGERWTVGPEGAAEPNKGSRRGKGA